MTAAIIMHSDYCGGRLDPDSGEVLRNGRIMRGSVLFDLAVVLTTLVVGILGACSVISMSPACAYSLIGIGAAFILAYVSYVIRAGIEQCVDCDQCRADDRF